MRKSAVWRKFILTFLLLTIVYFVLLNTVGKAFLRRQLIRNEESELYRIANDVVDTYVAGYYSSKISRSTLTTNLEKINESIGVRFWLINNFGTITLDSGKEAQSLVADEFIKGFLDRPMIENMTMQSVIKDPMLCVTTPIIIDATKRGYISAMVPMSKISEQGVLYTNYANIGFLLFIPCFIVALVILYITTIRPINRMTKAVKKFLDTNYKKELVLSYPDEIAELGSTIKFMGDKLNGIDKTQRKFLSNVSHDFRSPLTSIRGYLEAMKDGTIEKDEQEKYFDILLYETERLTKLTSNLLELNTMDDNGIILNPTVFDINGMIKQIALTFEGTCKKRKIVLNLIFSQKESFVSADADRIQQVIYNLLDNAIKFSNADSSIKITTEEKGNKVFVAVKDHGAGIPKESLNKIWDRFYKIDASRGRDKKGSGLGLSIVKEIIKAHGEEISVASTVGVGTEFVFTVKSAE